MLYFSHMQRGAYQKLLDWKNTEGRQPLLIQGARQVGKTYLMRDFGRREFEHVAYFNFEQQPVLCSLFDRELQPDQIIQGLQLLANMLIDPENTLIIFDEIQVCKNAITALKYFEEAESDYYILTAGSLLGVAIHEGVSFPVGKVGFLTLYPFDFLEFLTALGKYNWVEVIKNQQHEHIRVLSSVLEQKLKEYMIIGGMPAVVMQFAESGNFELCRIKQMEILQSYENDFSKHSPIAQLPRIRQVWQSLVGQLTKENAKFIYSQIRRGARAKEFESAINWLVDAGMVHKVTRLKKSGFPLEAYAQWEDFKLYLNDVGLLGAMAQLPVRVVLEDHLLFTEFKGVLAEQFVLQQLLASGRRGYYWHPENAAAEVDFLMVKGMDIVPIEVKAGRNVKSKSLSVYHDKYPAHMGLRLSLLPHKHQDWMSNLPLYSFVGWLQG